MVLLEDLHHSEPDAEVIMSERHKLSTKVYTLVPKNFTFNKIIFKCMAAKTNSTDGYHSILKVWMDSEH